MILHLSKLIKRCTKKGAFCLCKLYLMLKKGVWGSVGCAWALRWVMGVRGRDADREGRGPLRKARGGRPVGVRPRGSVRVLCCSVVPGPGGWGFSIPDGETEAPRGAAELGRPEASPSHADRHFKNVILGEKILQIIILVETAKYKILSKLNR